MAFYQGEHDFPRPWHFAGTYFQKDHQLIIISICLSIYLPIYLSYLSIYLSVCLSVYLSNCMFKKTRARQITPCDSLFLSRNQRVSGPEMALPILQQRYQKLKETRAVNVFGFLGRFNLIISGGLKPLQLGVPWDWCHPLLVGCFVEQHHFHLDNARQSPLGFGVTPQLKQAGVYWIGVG